MEKNTIETCRFKAIVKIREDLTPEEKAIVDTKMTWLFLKLNVITDDGFTYYCPVRDNQEMANVSFFVIELEDLGNYFDEIQYIEVPKVRHPDYYKYRFKVVAKPKANLSPEDQKLLDDKTDWLLSKLNVTTIDNDYTYYCPVRDNKELGNITFFYIELEEVKQCFEKLEYYDYIKESFEVAI